MMEIRAFPERDLEAGLLHLGQRNGDIAFGRRDDKDGLAIRCRNFSETLPRNV
jgi:hypothetical protein